MVFNCEYALNTCYLFCFEFEKLYLSSLLVTYSNIYVRLVYHFYDSLHLMGVCYGSVIFLFFFSNYSAIVLLKS